MGTKIPHLLFQNNLLCSLIKEKLQGRGRKVLGIEMHTTIKTLYEKGYNKSQIARILKVDRKTVRKVLKALDENGYVEHKTKPSILDPYKECINIQVSKGLSAKRIY